jgi:hypothetical protein
MRIGPRCRRQKESRLGRLGLGKRGLLDEFAGFVEGLRKLTGLSLCYLPFLDYSLVIVRNLMEWLLKDCVYYLFSLGFSIRVKDLY